MHAMDIPASVRAIGRAGAGVNNIPVDKMSKRGVPVFNAPGANANAVKELVIAGVLLGGAQPRAGAALHGGPGGRRQDAAQAGGGRQEAVLGLRAAAPHARRHRAGQGRKPRRRRRDQARHERARLRSAHHGRRGVEPALAGAQGPQRRGSAEGVGFRDAARAASRRDPRHDQRRADQADEERRGPAQFRPRGHRGRRRRARGARGEAAALLRVRLSGAEAAGAPAGRWRCRTSAPRRARPRTTAR